MKKFFLSVLFFFLCLSSVFSWQKTYRASDKEYKIFSALKTISGVALPEMTTPVTAVQMLNALDLLNENELFGYAKELYEDLYKELSEPDVFFRFGDVGGNIDISVSPFSIYGNITDDDSVNDDFVVKENGRYNIYSADAELFITEHFFGKLRINGTQITGCEKLFMDDKLRFVSIFKLDKMSQDWPEQAYGSVGTEYMNLTVGRDRLSAGNGVTGNLYLSENRRFDDFLKFSIGKGPVSYDFTSVVYDGYKTDGGVIASPLELLSADFDSPKKMVFIHRFSSSLFRKITVSAYEGAVIYGNNIFSDLRVLNPFMVIHNNGTYYSGNTNNFAGIELGVKFKGGIETDLQILVDQFQLSGESDESGKTQMGFLANVKGAWILKKGLLTAYAEGVFASKGLYLKEKDNTSNGYDDNGNTYYYAQTDMISGYKRYASDEFDEYRYLGYSDGGNLFKIALGAEYRLKKYMFGLNASFTSKGYYGIGKNEQRILDLSAESGFDKTQYCFNLSAFAEANFLKGIDCKVVLSSVNYSNYQHVNNRNSNQVQVYLGCRIRPLEFFTRRMTIQ